MNWWTYTKKRRGRETTSQYALLNKPFITPKGKMLATLGAIEYP